VNKGEQGPNEGAEGALARFESPPWGNEAAMSDTEERREDAPNQTQEAIDEGGPSDQPVDVEWEETESPPHQGEEGQQPV
jgi:hypothetical protein